MFARVRRRSFEHPQSARRAPARCASRLLAAAQRRARAAAARGCCSGRGATLRGREGCTSLLSLAAGTATALADMVLAPVSMTAAGWEGAACCPESPFSRPSEMTRNDKGEGRKGRPWSRAETLPALLSNAAPRQRGGRSALRIWRKSGVDASAHSKISLALALPNPHGRWSAVRYR